MAAYAHRFAAVVGAMAAILILPSLRPAPAQTPPAPAKPEMTENCPGLVASDQPRVIPADFRLAALNPAAAAHHEKRDGSGYHRRLRGDGDDPGASVLAATEIYVGLTTERADRPARAPADAAAELRRLVGTRARIVGNDGRDARVDDRVVAGTGLTG